MRPEEYSDKYIVGAGSEIDAAVEQLTELEGQRTMFARVGADLTNTNKKIAELEERFLNVDDIYKLPATTEDLEKISKVFGVNFIVGAGLDRSQMLGAAPDRTVFACVARGIVDENTSYYFLLDLFIPRVPGGAILQDRLIDWTTRYGWIDKVAVEAYQSQDFYHWLIDKGYEAEFLTGTYKSQKLTFTNMFQIVNGGYFKAPTVPYYLDENGDVYEGYTNKEDIMREELGVFTHMEGKWFGAPEKRIRKAAPKDDTVFAVNYALHATQGMSVNDLASRTAQSMVSDVHVNKDVVGMYR